MPNLVFCRAYSRNDKGLGTCRTASVASKQISRVLLCQIWIFSCPKLQRMGTWRTASVASHEISRVMLWQIAPFCQFHAQNYKGWGHGERRASRAKKFRGFCFAKSRFLSVSCPTWRSTGTCCMASIASRANLRILLGQTPILLSFKHESTKDVAIKFEGCIG